jgi:hypothetical protein
MTQAHDPAAEAEYLELSNAFITLANERLTGDNHMRVGMAMIAAAARFNAYLVTAATGSPEAARAEAARATSALTGRFEKSLKSNLDDYVANFDRYSSGNA